MTRVAAAAFATTLLAGCGGSKATAPPAPRASFPEASACRKHPLAGVHSPDRLKLLAPCRAIVGVVKEPRVSRDDGDEVFNLSPADAYASMLNHANVEEGGLHVEIVPADQPGCKRGEAVHRGTVPELGLCTGAHVALPAAGAHVRVVGAFVLDVPNHWREIHPAWSVTRASG